MAFSVGLGDDRVDGLNGLGDPATDGDFKEDEEENFEADGTEDFFGSAELELATGLVEMLEREARRLSATEGLGFAGVDAVDESRCRGVAGELMLARRSAIPKGVPMLFRLLRELALTAALELEAFVMLVRTTLSVGKLPLLSTLRVLEAV